MKTQSSSASLSEVAPPITVRYYGGPSKVEAVSCDADEMSILRSVFLVALLAASLIWTGCSKKETFRIGLAGASTGIFYIIWQNFYEGAQLAASEINSQGGVLGRPVQLFPTDDQVRVDLGVIEMKKLILRDQVHIVVGGSSSHVGAAQSGLALRYKVPYIIANCTSAVLAEDKGHRYLFQLTPSSRMEAHAVAVFVAKQGWKKICYLMPDYEWGHTFKRVIDEKLAQIAPETVILREFWPKIDEPEYAPYITAIQAAKPDAVINGMAGASIINFTKQAIGYGLFESLPVIGLYDLNALKTLGQDMPEGAVGYNKGAFFSVPGPQMERFVEKFQATYNDYPSATAVFGYEGVHMAKLAAEQAGTLEDRERIVDALSKLHFESPRGDLYFREYHNQANATVYIGFTAKDSRYPFLTYRDTLAVPAEQTWPTIETVQALRSATQR